MSKRTQMIVLVALGVVVVAVVVFQIMRAAPAPPVTPAVAGKTAAVAKTGAPAGAGKTTSAAKTASESAGKEPASDATQIKKADVNIDELLAGIKEVDFDYEQNRLPRDPMAPLVGTLTRKEGEGEEKSPLAPATAVQVMNKVVSGIVWDERRPLAVVDNEVVYAGYVYADGTTVESIERDRVIFKVGDSLIQNPLKEF